jgi:hypothetical protein
VAYGQTAVQSAVWLDPAHESGPTGEVNKLVGYQRIPEITSHAVIKDGYGV